MLLHLPLKLFIRKVAKNKLLMIIISSELMVWKAPYALLIEKTLKFTNTSLNCSIFEFLLDHMNPLHTSEIKGLRSTKCSTETLQNLLYFMYKKTHVVFFIFHLVQFYFFSYECPGLCRHRPGHS